MKIRILIPLLILAAEGNASAFAQGFADDSSHHFRLALELGYGSIASYDNMGSPLPYSGITVPIGGTIEYVTPNVRHLLECIGIISLGNAAAMTDQYSSATDGRNVAYGFGDFRYRFTHYLTTIGSTNIRLSVGGEWDNLIFGRGYNYYGDWSGGSASGEASSGIAAAADLTYAIGNDHRFRGSVSLPLVAYVLRPAYGYINGNTSIFGFSPQSRIEPIGAMWSWRVGFDYDYAISRPFLLGLHFHELYYQYPMLAWRAVAAENELDVALTWRFDL
ncbi:MAG TPA: hypothetical protein VFD13_03970 [Candidatus Kapabacteria bacterium]|nr:hypothetical protein [Candidatus Kapabacteria bacterium]